MCVWGGGGERERETDRQTDRQTDRDFVFMADVCFV